jgi:uncharacterized protein YndB with AHSA1/START domain
MDVRAGGTWRFVMHGPDGRDYANLVTFIEVTPPERLVYRHRGENADDPVAFETTVILTEESGRTRLDMRMVFPSAAARDFAAREYGAVAGLTQTIARLAAHVARPHRAARGASAPEHGP